MYQKIIADDLKKVVQKLGFKAGDIVLTIPESSNFGDYSTNIPLQLSKQEAKKSYQSAKEIASDIITQFGHPAYLERLDVAGPGFINFFLKDESLVRVLKDSEEGAKESSRKASNNNGGVPERILMEYAQPNTHKEFHIGHLRNITIGESIARMLEYSGKEVYRANYGSDIGLPVAKAIWGVLRLKDEYERVKNSTLRERAEFLGRAYAYAHKHYEDNPAVKEEVDTLNKKIYERDPEYMDIWNETKQWSLGYFDTIYVRLGSEFDVRINESDIEAEGKDLVLQNIGKVFKYDDGAVIFPGEEYGLHNRVFVTSKGNPTYEAKELGLTRREEELFPFDYSLHVVDTQQTEYFKVVIKALELIEARYKEKKKHIPHGFVSLTTGKMSSRAGNIISADMLIDEVKKEIVAQYPGRDESNQDVETIAIAAIKFFYLKFALTTDITFDIKQSISLHGDTGPYILYTFARTVSLLAKLPEDYKPKPAAKTPTLESEEREVLQWLEYFDHYVVEAVKKYEPNELCIYLLRLAKVFNTFYEKWPVIGGPNEEFRLLMVVRVGEALKLGLYLLGIETVNKM